MTVTEFHFDKPDGSGLEISEIGFTVDRHGTPPGLAWGEAAVFVSRGDQLAASDWAGYLKIDDRLRYTLAGIRGQPFRVPEHMRKTWTDKTGDKKLHLRLHVGFNVHGRIAGVDDKTVLLTVGAHAIWIRDKQ